MAEMAGGDGDGGDDDDYVFFGSVFFLFCLARRGAIAVPRIRRAAGPIRTSFRTS